MASASKKYLDTITNWMLLLVSIFIAFVFERLYDLNQYFILLNYYISRNIINDFSFYTILMEDNIILTNKVLIVIFLLFISLLSYVYILKQITQPSSMRAILIGGATFLWFFIAFLLILSSLDKMNISLIPLYSIDIEAIKDLTIIAANLDATRFYLRSIINLTVFAPAGTAAICFALFNVSAPKSKKQLIEFWLCVVNIIITFYMYHTSSMLGNIVYGGGTIIGIMPGGPNAHISYPIADWLLAATMWFWRIYTGFAAATIFERDIGQNWNLLRDKLHKWRFD